MMHVTRPAIMATAAVWAAVVLPTSDALAQQRLIFKVSAENTKYVQQHMIDVGDVTGHKCVFSRSTVPIRPTHPRSME